MSGVVIMAAEVRLGRQPFQVDGTTANKVECCIVYTRRRMELTGRPEEKSSSSFASHGRPKAEAEAHSSSKYRGEGGTGILGHASTVDAPRTKSSLEFDAQPMKSIM